MFQLIYNLTARWVSPIYTNMKSPVYHTLRLCSAHCTSAMGIIMMPLIYILFLTAARRVIPESLCEAMDY